MQKARIRGLLFAVTVLLCLTFLSTVKAQTTVTVLDSKTLQPISGANVYVSCIAGNVNIPFGGVTNAQGIASIDTGSYSQILWQVTATGYLTQTGSGHVPPTIYLVSSAQNSPSQPIPGVSWLSMTLIAAIIIVVATAVIVAVVTLRHKKHGR